MNILYLIANRTNLMKYIEVVKAQHYVLDVYQAMSKRTKYWILLCLDLTAFAIAGYIAFCARFETLYPLVDFQTYVHAFAVTTGVKLLVLHKLKTYQSVIRYTGIEIFHKVLISLLLSGCTSVMVIFLGQINQLPRSVLVIDIFLSFLLIVYPRLAVRKVVGVSLLKKHMSTYNRSRVIIYGAGSAGSQLCQALASGSFYQVIGFVDDDVTMHGRFVNGIKVYSCEQLLHLTNRLNVDAIVLAMPSATKSTIKKVVESLENLPIEIKTVPSIVDILSGKIAISNIRQIEVTDLLNREEVLPDPDLLSADVVEKVVLVTGAGGSIGSELCRQIAQLNPLCLILFERNEFALYKIEQELLENYSDLYFVPLLGDIKDKDTFQEVLIKYNVQTIYHAAAYKHVPLVESNPQQGIVNNIYGTLTVAQAAAVCGIKKFVLISTDKAVRPTNIMGSSKRVCELVLQALAAEPNIRTQFTMVRFGNVLDSTGSVVPRFRKQIQEGKDITITHPEITRYFMSIPEAARLVIQAGAMGTGGEVFLLDMGQPIKIYDLALQMIKLSGLTSGKDINIKFTGLRPGEKLYEELLIDGSNIRSTKHPKIYASCEGMIPWKDLEPLIHQLLKSCKSGNTAEMITLLKRLVPEYQSNSQKQIRQVSMVSVQGVQS